MFLRCVLLIAGITAMMASHAEMLSARRLGVVFNVDDTSSRSIAQYYAAQRGIPAVNVVGIRLPAVNVIAPANFSAIRAELLDRLPAAVQALVLVWSRPYAVGCMSITSAFTAGYKPAFCEPGCARTEASPLYDSVGWLPADTVGWWPAMLLPSENPALARALISRGIASDATRPSGTLYLVRTGDGARNVRASTYGEAEELLARRVSTKELLAPVVGDIPDAIAYFTGAARVGELRQIHFRPGAVADHLTSAGGVLYGGTQMSALAWIEQGATASYGTVSEPCNHLGKFPNVAVLMKHYRQGETLLESYWKSVAMPGQGLFIGEPLARPFSP